jgi:hypothetical protein
VLNLALLYGGRRAGDDGGRPGLAPDGPTPGDLRSSARYHLKTT